ncbi:MAG: hypothetical protein J0665_16390 [Deltaproteobacteria bacterium]|nr:hypothetical protein [Deltaproteobacteria bacterium]
MENKKGVPLKTAGSLGTPSNFSENNTISAPETQAKCCLAVAGRSWWKQHQAKMLARETARQAGEVSR